MSAISTADVPTDRPERFAKQLVSHLGRRNGGEWSDESGTGFIQLTSGRADLTCGSGVLHLRVEGEVDALSDLEDVVGRHLVRFDSSNQLVVSWNRADGPGSRQPAAE